MLVVVIAVRRVTVAVMNVVHMVVMRDGFMAAAFTMDVFGMFVGYMIVTHEINICTFVHSCKTVEDPVNSPC